MNLMVLESSHKYQYEFMVFKKMQIDVEINIDVYMCGLVFIIFVRWEGTEVMIL